MLFLRSILFCRLSSSFMLDLKVSARVTEVFVIIFIFCTMFNWFLYKMDIVVLFWLLLCLFVWWNLNETDISFKFYLLVILSHLSQSILYSASLWMVNTFMKVSANIFALCFYLYGWCLMLEPYMMSSFSCICLVSF